MKTTLNFEWDYEDYLAITEREDTKDNQARWLEVTALINNKHYESVDNEIRETIVWVDKEIKENEK